MISEVAGDLACCLYSVVRGHHIYKRLWTPIIGEQVDVIHEDENELDVRAVAIMKVNVFIASDEVIFATDLQMRFHSADKHVYC